jgi:hypothetical protein
MKPFLVLATEVRLVSGSAITLDILHTTNFLIERKHESQSFRIVTARHRKKSYGSEFAQRQDSNHQLVARNGVQATPPRYHPRRSQNAGAQREYPDSGRCFLTEGCGARYRRRSCRFLHRQLMLALSLDRTAFIASTMYDAHLESKLRLHCRLGLLIGLINWAY